MSDMPPELPRENLKPCDLVMKGGITSGVVYPRAVLQLKEEYYFRSIGGTSAGAIAAAATAAAEYGRGSGGFEKLARATDGLEVAGMLANLFQPAPMLYLPLRGLIRMLEVQDAHRRREGRFRGFKTAIQALGAVADLMMISWLSWVMALVGVAIGLGWLFAISDTVISFGGIGLALSLLALIIAAVTGAFVGLLLHVVLLVLYRVPRNFYGICTGMDVASHHTHPIVPLRDTDGKLTTTQRYQALTPWLSDLLNTVAGLSADEGPLTFHHLQYNHLDHVNLAHQIELNVVTTNLSQSMPYVVPFSDNLFLFSYEEFAELFPPDVVAYLVQHQYPSVTFQVPVEITEQGPGKKSRQHHLYFLPSGLDLPVIVAARMSLSFPVLLSAVPLWTISESTFRDPAFAAARQAKQPFVLRSEYVRRNWFSDGGICSNFPIHFYDRWVPPHPTFGINLEQVREDQWTATVQGNVADTQASEPYQTPVEGNDGGFEQEVMEQRSSQAETPTDSRDILLPSSYPKDRPGPLWQPLDHNLFGFLSSIVGTAISYRDTTQAQLTSYYDRIVTVRLKQNEGGMNLNMPPQTIQGLAAKGHQAGVTIRQKFDFDHHRWVRLRLLLSEMEQQLMSIRRDLGLDDSKIDQEQIEQLLVQIRQLNFDNGMINNAIQQVLEAEVTAYKDPATRYPYARDEKWLERVALRLNLLLLLVEVWGREPGKREPDLQLGRSIPQESRVRDDEDGVRLRVTPDL